MTNVYIDILAASDSTHFLWNREPAVPSPGLVAEQALEAASER